jgi:hypothetical protein
LNDSGTADRNQIILRFIGDNNIIIELAIAALDGIAGIVRLNSRILGISPVDFGIGCCPGLMQIRNRFRNVQPRGIG